MKLGIGQWVGVGPVLAALAIGCGSASGGGDDGGADGGDGDGDGGPGDLGDGGPQPDESDLVFAPDVLHQIAIEVAESDLPTLDDVNDRVPCTVTFDGTTVVDAGVRNKGQTSLRGVDDKLSFSIKLDQFVDGQRLHGLKRLILSNTVQDPSFANEAMTYLVYERAGLPAPRTAHAVVSLNGEVKGIYVIVEAVDRQFLERHYGDDMGDGNLYEGPWDFPQGADAAELKDEVDEMRSRDDLEALTDVVTDADDDALADALAPLLDVDQFVRSIAVEAVTCAWDGYLYAAWNFYLYHRPAGGPWSDGFVILPHGANWPYWHADLDPFDFFVYPWGDGTEPGQLAVRLRDSAELDAAYATQVADVAGDPFDADTLLARIDQIGAVLAGADDGAPAVADDLAGLDDALAEARTFVVEREAYLVDLLD